jgi:hypothetical protein
MIPDCGVLVFSITINTPYITIGMFMLVLVEQYSLLMAYAYVLESPSNITSLFHDSP